jgi:hypothetical protein
MASISGHRRGAWRRKLLTIGGISALTGLVSPSGPVAAAHDAEDIGIGLDNPFDGTTQGAATSPTKLRTDTATAGFEVVQAAQRSAEAISAVGGGSSTSATGGRGLAARGGDNSNSVPQGNGGEGANIVGGSLTAGTLNVGRSGGVGLVALGGDGSTRGVGGHGISAMGGSSTATPGAGVEGRGGKNVQQQSGAVGGVGVRGIGGTDTFDQFRTGAGVAGESDAGVGVAGTSSLASGVLGNSTASFGVFGSSSSGIGVKAQSGTSVAARADSLGSTANALEALAAGSGFGVLGMSSAGVGVRGIGFGGTAAGVEGVASNSGPGVWGFAGAGHGVLGNSSTGNGGVFAGKTGLTATGNPNAIVANGNLVCTGTGFFTGGPYTIASRSADGALRATYGVTSPEALVEDIGRARLTNGVARVELDPMFAALATADIAVFLTPRGDCLGLYVAAQTPTEFEVRELQAGRSTLDFDYRMVARRADGTATRFAAVDLPRPIETAEPPARPRLEEFVRPHDAAVVDRALESIGRRRDATSRDATPDRPSGGAPPTPRR